MTVKSNFLLIPIISVDFGIRIRWTTLYHVYNIIAHLSNSCMYMYMYVCKMYMYDIVYP